MTARVTVHKSEIARHYDAVAAEYDDDYAKPEYIEENLHVAGLIDDYVGIVDPVLDIGCGTGLLLEMFPNLEPDNYLGLDLSMGMVRTAQRKFPYHTFAQADIEDWLAHTDGQLFNTAIALFGIWSYLDSPTMTAHRLFHSMYPGGRVFIMCYGEDEPRPNLRDSEDSRLYRPKTLGTILKSAGFDGVEYVGYHHASIAWGMRGHG